MGAVTPAPRTDDPLRLVVSRSMRSWARNYTTDTLECGHEVTDYDNRDVKRRRCRECGKKESTS